MEAGGSLKVNANQLYGNYAGVMPVTVVFTRTHNQIVKDLLNLRYQVKARRYQSIA